jgi:uncharacterized membrane protein YeiH
MTLDTVFAWCDLVAVGVFAAFRCAGSGGKTPGYPGLRVLFGTMTGVGGGTLRDLLLDVPVFWISDTRYLWICVALSALTWYLAPMLSRPGVACCSGPMRWGWRCSAYWAVPRLCSSTHPAIVAIVMGVMSASFGGLIRDTLLGRASVMMGA